MIVSHGVSVIAPNLLILGGTTEATALCAAVHAANLRATVSFAGRVERPARQPVPRRIGGFGGADGLAAHIEAEGITHLVDATHPFAAQMSRNAVEAAAATGIPMCALTRPPWTAQSGDCWQNVSDIPAVIEALKGPARRIMLAVGRMHLEDFAANPQHFYLLRLVDAPKVPPAFPEHTVIVSRGPFDADGDAALMRTHGIDLVVSKNAGGPAAYAKIEAARSLHLPVLMIDRPALPARRTFTQPDAVIGWVRSCDHAATPRGV